MDKISTDGEEQLPSSPTGGLPNLQPSNPYLQQAAIQPYPKANPTLQQAPQSAAKHPNPAAEATDAAEPIIRDYGITN